MTVMYGILLDKESGASESSLASCFTAWVVMERALPRDKFAWRTATCHLGVVYGIRRQEIGDEEWAQHPYLLPGKLRPS